MNNPKSYTKQGYLAALGDTPELQWNPHRNLDSPPETFHVLPGISQTVLFSTYWTSVSTAGERQGIQPILLLLYRVPPPSHSNSPAGIIFNFSPPLRAIRRHTIRAAEYNKSAVQRTSGTVP